MVQKIVINSCHGGFSLSETGVRAYAEKKGFPLYEEAGRFGKTFWLVPIEERVVFPPSKDWVKLPVEERIALNQMYRGQTLYSRDIDRDDSILVQVVEELGDKADGEFASLKIVEIPDDVDWQIEEYDGLERIAEAHRTWP